MTRILHTIFLAALFAFIFIFYFFFGYLSKDTSNDFRTHGDMILSREYTDIFCFPQKQCRFEAVLVLNDFMGLKYKEINFNIFESITNAPADSYAIVYLKSGAKLSIHLDDLLIKLNERKRVFYDKDNKKWILNF
jgi:hypothetical protein